MTLCCNRCKKAFEKWEEDMYFPVCKECGEVVVKQSFLYTDDTEDDSDF